MNDNTPGGKRMTMQDMVKITNWISTHKDILPLHTLAQLCRMITTDIQIKIHPDRLAQFERAAGFERPKGGTSMNKKDRAVILGKILRDLLVKLGADVPDDLNDICSGR